MATSEAPSADTRKLSATCGGSRRASWFTCTASVVVPVRCAPMSLTRHASSSAANSRIGRLRINAPGTDRKPSEPVSGAASPPTEAGMWGRVTGAPQARPSDPYPAIPPGTGSVSYRVYAARAETQTYMISRSRRMATALKTDCVKWSLAAIGCYPQFGVLQTGRGLTLQAVP